ncbi:MAG: NarK family nitrate/nitrite MFS transporter [Myxococcales bacterium]
MSRWIQYWNPENEAFWTNTGRRVARRNLIWSIVAENIGFSVWMLWSVVAPRLPRMGFGYSTDQLFTLVAVPGLVGSLMRFPYTFAVPKFGGRNWTIISALLLLIPTALLSFLVCRPDTPYPVMLMAAATAGLGGGNFASSMANISFFYPDREKGYALGLNAAGGNIGVSSVQLVVPIAIGIQMLPGVPSLANAGLMWMLPILIAALGAATFMDNLSTARSSFADQLQVVRYEQTWIVAFLYVATFGSFVGYSAAFPLLLKTQFPEANSDLAFLGPLVGSVARPVGGWISDRLSGSRVTLWNFVAMACLTLGVMHFVQVHDFVGFMSMFLLLFVTSGVGNGSTFRMIPVIFREQSLRRANNSPEGRELALRDARREAAAVLGLSSAIGAIGGYVIPRSFGASIKATGGPGTALTWFLAYYAVCVGITWWYYRRRSFLVQRVAALTDANA